MDFSSEELDEDAMYWPFPFFLLLYKEGPKAKSVGNS